MMLNTWIVEKGVTPFTPGDWGVTNIQRSEVHWFQTQEWAQLCAAHFNRLENIKYADATINIGSTDWFLTTNSPNIQISHQAEQSDWICHLFGSNGDGISWTPKKGKVPNWFWRKMQYLFFGNKWVKK